MLPLLLNLPNYVSFPNFETKLQYFNASKVQTATEESISLIFPYVATHFTNKLFRIDSFLNWEGHHSVSTLPNSLTLQRSAQRPSNEPYLLQHLLMCNLVVVKENLRFKHNFYTFSDLALSLRISNAFVAEVVPFIVLSLCRILFLELANFDRSCSSVSRAVLLKGKARMLNHHC